MKWNHILTLTSSSSTTSTSPPPPTTTTTDSLNNQNENTNDVKTNNDSTNRNRTTDSFKTFKVIWMNMTTIMIYVVQYLAALPPLIQRLFVHSIQPLFVGFFLILWVQLMMNPIYFLVILGGIILAVILKLIHKIMKQNLVENNSLKFSLKIVTEYTNELTNTTLEPSTSSILWAQPNPLNLSPQSSTNLYLEEDNPDEVDEEICQIELKTLNSSPRSGMI